MVDGGWTLRHRKRWKHEYYRDPLLVAMVEWMIDHAAYEDTIVELAHPLKAVKVKRGQVLYSQRELAKWFKVGRQQIRARQGFLKKAEFSTHQPTQGHTIVTIINYNKYQASPNSSNPTANPEPTQGPTHHPLNKRNKLNKKADDNFLTDGGLEAAKRRQAKTSERIKQLEKMEAAPIVKNLSGSLKGVLRDRAKDQETKF